MDLAGVGWTALSLGLILTVCIIVGALMIVITMLILYYKKFTQFKCVIWEKDGFGQNYESYDSAGIFVDRKTQNKLLFLRKNNVGLEPNNIPYIQGGKRKIIYLRKTGLKNFSFITPKLYDQKIELQIGEQDLNWMGNSYERLKKLIGGHWILPYMPYIMIAFTTIMILIIFIYFFKNFDDLRAFGESLVVATSNAKQTI